jgi:hypothetical protein
MHSPPNAISFSSSAPDAVSSANARAASTYRTNHVLDIAWGGCYSYCTGLFSGGKPNWYFLFMFQH